MNSDSTLTSKFTAMGKEGTMYAAGSVIGRLAGIFLIPLYTSVLATSDYGIMGLVVMVGKIAGAVFAFGLRSSLLRSFYDYDEDAARKTIISTVLYLTMASSTVLLLCGFFFADDLSGVLFDSQKYSLYFILIVSVAVFEMFTQLALGVFRARHEPAKFVLFQTLSVLLRAGSIIYLVAVMGWGLRGVFVGQFAAAAVSAASMLWLIRGGIVLKFSTPEARKMIRFGLPLVFVSIFGFVSTYIDRVILNHYVTLDKVGLYTLAYQLGTLTNIILIVPLKRVWGPMFLSVKDHDNFGPFCAKALSYILCIAGFIFLIVALLSKELLAIMAEPEYWACYGIIPIIALTYAIWSIRSIIEVGVFLKRKTTLIAYYTCIGAVINVILNIILIPRYEMAGAAWATFISFMVTLAIDYFYNRRLFRVDYEWTRIIKICIASAVIFAAGFFIVIDNIILSAAFKIITILLYPFLLLGLGFFEKPEITRIKKVLGSALNCITPCKQNEDTKNRKD